MVIDREQLGVIVSWQHATRYVQEMVIDREQVSWQLVARYVQQIRTSLVLCVG